MAPAKMKICALVLGFLASAALPAWAQGHPKAELYFGFSHAPLDLGPDFGNRRSTYGLQASVSYNPHKNLRLVVLDLGVQFKSENPLTVPLPPGTNISFISGADLTRTHYQFLFGPEFTTRFEKVNAFVHALAGFGGTSLRFERASGNAIFVGQELDSRNGFAAGLGGGVDVRVSSVVFLRLAQLDYLPTSPSGVRFSAGLLFSPR